MKKYKCLHCGHEWESGYVGRCVMCGLGNVKEEGAYLREDVLTVMDRIKVASESCNSHHITCVINQVRGMIWIITGQDPGILEDTEQVCKLLKVPYEKKETEIIWGTEVDPNW